MPRERSFRRNVAIIGVVHVALLFGLARWGGGAKKPVKADIVWMNGGIAESSAAPTPEDAVIIAPPVETEIETETAPPVEQEAPELPAAPTEASLPSPSPVPKPSAIPRPSPRSSVKPSPKPTPKKTLAVRASPKPTPRVAEKPARNPGDGVAAETEPAGAAAGSGAGETQFGWYARMLHDRFYREWAQPTSVVATGARMSALVKIRIEKDGRVSDFTVVRSSGNVVVDESVAAIARRVTRVDALPAGLGAGDQYEVKINFEFNAD